MNNIEELNKNESYNGLWKLEIYKEMMEITEKIELEGNCMLVPIYNPSKISKDDFTKEEALMLDKMHKERIKLADAILVVDIGGYIGNTIAK